MSNTVNKLCVVTGTSSGIGAATGASLLDAGWQVIGIARRPTTLRNPHYRHLQIDLTDLAALHRHLGSLVGELGLANRRRVGLVNNAASGDGLGPLPALDPEEFRRIMAVNVVAPTWLMGYVLRSSAPDATIRIVNVSSGATTTAFPGLGAYGASKAALRMAGMVLAQEIENPGRAGPQTRRDIAIISYEPGVVDTEMQESARSRPPEVFPWVDMFLAFAERGAMVQPELPGRDIAAILDADDLPTFSERRLRG